MVTVAKNGKAPAKALELPALAGFQMPSRIVEFDFAEDSEYHGAVVRCRKKFNFEQAFNLKRVFQAPEGDEVTPEELNEQARCFAEAALLGWNLVDDDGRPLPATAEEFVAQPADFIQLVVGNWLIAVTGVSVPLASGSQSSAPSPGDGETTAAS